MKISKFGMLGLTLGGLLLMGAEARAIDVRFATVGIFTSSGTGTVTSGPVSIRFEGTPDGFVGVPPASATDFGSFIVETTDPNTQDFSDFNTGFELQIFQIEPTGAPIPALVFSGTLSGGIRGNNSQATLQFDTSSLMQMVGDISYEIVNSVNSTPGLMVLAAPSAGGVSTVNGRINAIPEPSTLVLLGLGAAAPAGLALRRRLKGRTPA